MTEYSSNQPIRKEWTEKERRVPRTLTSTAMRETSKPTWLPEDVFGVAPARRSRVKPSASLSDK